MYISRAEITMKMPRHGLRPLSHVGAYHSWVEDSFPNEREQLAENSRIRKLWRIDKISTLEGEKKYLILVSPTMPDVEKFATYVEANSIEIKEYGNYIASFKEGDKLRFKLTVHPTISEKPREINLDNALKADKVTEVPAGNVADTKILRKRGRVRNVVGQKGLTYYLLSKSIKHGFYLTENDFTITDIEDVVLRKNYDNSKSLKKEFFSRVTYEGVLVVTDIELFRLALIQGIGKKKAYGCGMLTVIRL